MTDNGDKRSPGDRRKLGHTIQFNMKIHPDLMRHLEHRAVEDYCSVAEVMRKLILDDMRERTGS